MARCSASPILLLFLKSIRATLIASLAIPLEPVDHLRLSVPHGRHAQPDVAGRTGGRDRPDYRRHGRGHRKHLAASGGRRDGRQRHRSRQQRDQRRRHRFDLHDDPRVPAAGIRARRDRPVLSIVEPGPFGFALGVDGRQPDHHPRAGVAVSGSPRDADHRPDLRDFCQWLRRAAAEPACDSRDSACSWPC